MSRCDCPKVFSIIHHGRNRYKSSLPYPWSELFLSVGTEDRLPVLGLFKNPSGVSKIRDTWLLFSPSSLSPSSFTFFIYRSYVRLKGVPFRLTVLRGRRFVLGEDYLFLCVFSYIVPLSVDVDMSIFRVGWRWRLLNIKFEHKILYLYP